MVPTNSRNPEPSGSKGGYRATPKVSQVESLQLMQARLACAVKGPRVISIRLLADWVLQARKAATPDGVVLLACRFAESKGLDPDLLYKCLCGHIMYFLPSEENANSRVSLFGNNEENLQQEVIPEGVTEEEFSSLGRQYITALILAGESGRKANYPSLPEGLNLEQVQSLLGMIRRDLSRHNAFAQAYKVSEQALRGRAKGYKNLNSRTRMGSFESKSEGDGPADPSSHK